MESLLSRLQIRVGHRRLFAALQVEFVCPITNMASFHYVVLLLLEHYCLGSILCLLYSLSRHYSNYRRLFRISQRILR